MSPSIPLFRPAKPLGLWLSVIVLMSMTIITFSAQPTLAADNLTNWDEIPLQITKNSDLYSIDGTQPNILISHHLDYGTVKHNWTTGTSSQLQTGLLRELNFKTGIYYSTTRTKPEQVI